jgi:hypothetical protein
MADLNLTDFLKESSVSDLDWLDVDEQQYHETEVLPKQNLDAAPDLEALWSHEDEAPSKFVPNTGEPKTVGDLSDLHGKLRALPEDIVRTARLAIMQTTDPARIQSSLTSRYDLEALRGSRTALAGVLAERGLLGRYYIDAADFPRCAQEPRSAAEFARRYAGSAPFVRGKSACEGCQFRQMRGPNPICGVFQKQIVMDVPYTEPLADKVEQSQKSRGLQVQASAGSPRDRIRAAMMASEAEGPRGYTGQPQAAPRKLPALSSEEIDEVLTASREASQEAQSKVSAEEARPIVALLRREMLKGWPASELIKGLRLAFSVEELKATKDHWMPLLKEAGLYGTLYSTQSSFSDCHEGADFLARHSSKVRAIVAGEKCGSCIFHKVGRCLLYGKSVVESAEDLYTPDTVSAVLDEHRLAGNLPPEASQFEWGNTPREALQAIHQAAMEPKPSTSGDLRMAVEVGHYGSTVTHLSGELAKREVVKAAAKHLNEGLYGDDLRAALQSRFDPRDIAAAAAELRPILAEQGLVGIKYIDPSVYDDYGKGCTEAARLHRSRSAVKYAKIGSKCASCVHHKRPGFCSVLNKQLVVEPSYIDKKAEQKAILESGRSTEVSFESLMAHSLSTRDEYELQNHTGSFELNPEVPSLDVQVEFGENQKVGL